MGSTHAAEYAGMVRDGSTTLRAALTVHLQSNHYPPVPLVMIEPAEQAIKACSTGGQPDQLIRLPDRIAYRDGRDAIEAHEIVRALHLGAFLS